MKERIEGGKWEREGFLLKKWEGIGDRKEEKLKGEKNWRIEEGKKIICGKNGEMNDWLSNWLINLIKYDWWLIKTKFFLLLFGKFVDDGITDKLMIGKKRKVLMRRRKKKVLGEKLINIERKKKKVEERKGDDWRNGGKNDDLMNLW